MTAVPERSSCLYVGRIQHRRYRPIDRRFGYRLFWAYLDLDELETVFDGAWLWSTRRAAPQRFRRSDYLEPAELPLDEAVRQRVEQELGRRPTGAIRLLTQLRSFGFVFNPVSFYYCFDEQDPTRLDAIVAEITNTPWAERHAYVLDARAEPSLRFRFPKTFHVSPFFGMQQEYDWRFPIPGETLVVHMRNYEEGERVHDATLVLERRALTRSNLRRTLLRHPLPSPKILFAIYYQALRLKLAGARFHPHPKRTTPANPPGASPAP